MFSDSTAHRTITVSRFVNEIKVSNKLRVVVAIRIKLQPLVLPTEITRRTIINVLLLSPLLSTSLTLVIP